MNGKVALVTGASRGIGRGISDALAEKGWTVAINYRRNAEAAESAVEGAKQAGGDAFAVEADIAALDQHEELLQTVVEKTGRLDLLVNNAGIAPRTRTDILEIIPDQYDEILRTNLRGPFFLTQKAARLMIDQVGKKGTDSPAIITITSVSAEMPSINRGEYCISKAGLSMMSALWATRLAEYGISVYEIRPGIIRTDMTAGVKDKYDNLIEEGLTLNRRWGNPEDIGRAVTALAEGSFPYSTGAVFYLDGGMHISRL